MSVQYLSQPKPDRTFTLEELRHLTGALDGTVPGGFNDTFPSHAMTTISGDGHDTLPSLALPSSLEIDSISIASGRIRDLAPGDLARRLLETVPGHWDPRFFPLIAADCTLDSARLDPDHPQALMVRPGAATPNTTLHFLYASSPATTERGRWYDVVSQRMDLPWRVVWGEGGSFTIKATSELEIRVHPDVEPTMVTWPIPDLELREIPLFFHRFLEAIPSAQVFETQWAVYRLGNFPGVLSIYYDLLALQWPIGSEGSRLYLSGNLGRFEDLDEFRALPSGIAAETWIGSCTSFLDPESFEVEPGHFGYCRLLVLTDGDGHRLRVEGQHEEGAEHLYAALGLDWEGRYS